MNDSTTTSVAQAMTGVKTPHNHDVLCGRGGNINAHPGNVRFRESVERHRLVYLNSRFKEEKRLVAAAIVDEIRSLSPPGRFLAKDIQKDTWYDIGDEKASDKTRQALRENAPKHRKGSKRKQKDSSELESTTREKDEQDSTSSILTPHPAVSYPYPPPPQPWPNYYPPYGYTPSYVPPVPGAPPPPPPHPSNVPYQASTMYGYPTYHTQYPYAPYNQNNGQVQQQPIEQTSHPLVSQTSSSEAETNSINNQSLPQGYSLSTDELDRSMNMAQSGHHDIPRNRGIPAPSAESSQPSFDRMETKSPDESKIQEAGIIMSTLRSPTQQQEGRSPNPTSHHQAQDNFQRQREESGQISQAAKQSSEIGNTDVHRTATPDRNDVPGATTNPGSPILSLLPFSPIASADTALINETVAPQTPITLHQYREESGKPSNEQHPTPQNPHACSDDDNENKNMLLEQVAEHIRTSWDCDVDDDVAQNSKDSDSSL